MRPGSETSPKRTLSIAAEFFYRVYFSRRNFYLFLTFLSVLDSIFTIIVKSDIVTLLAFVGFKFAFRNVATQC